MPTTISREQWEALYELALDRLGGIRDVTVDIDLESGDLAHLSSREHSDDLRLLLDKIEVEEGSKDRGALAADPELLRRCLPQLRSLAKTQVSCFDHGGREGDHIVSRSTFVAEACDLMVTALEDQGDHR